MQPDIGAVCRSHLEFMKWADEIMLVALSQTPADRVSQDLGSSFQSMFGALNHVYLAEWLWLKRVRGEQDAQIADIESAPDLAALGLLWPALHQMWINWATALSTGDWPTLVTHRTRGIQYQMPCWQIVLHLVNHGSYHRGQVASMLRQSGFTPPGTDLITFYRTR
jgi:uncharacterized damage-inducible protein DinB